MTDVLIIGGGIVGNLAAAWFRRHMPALHVTVVGPTDQTLPVVGESLVEFSTLFMQEVGLGRHLVEQQLPKYGLSFYYKLDPAVPGDSRYAVDAVPTHPPLPSFLINRFSFDEALRRLNRGNGVEYVDGRATRIDFGNGAPHRVTVQRSDGTERTCPARWIIDATGRRRLLARRLGLGCGVSHQRSSFWFRLADFDAAILDRIDAVSEGVHPADTYYTAHHFFGRGNWVWLLPMRDDGGRRLISVGLTYRPDLFPDRVNSIPEFLDQAAREHPILGDFVRSGTVIDTNLYRNYMYGTRRRYSSRGWFLIGDAADTVDPLYSSGLALAVMAIQQVGAMIRRDREGGLTDELVGNLEKAYAGFHQLAGSQVARLYDVMHDGYQCHLRMHLHVTTIFHMAMPLFFSGYHADAVGAAMMARLGRTDGALARQLADFEPLIAEAARRSAGSRRRFIKVQSTFAMNYAWFEHRSDDAIPRSLSQMFRHMARMRLRLMWIAGARSWLRPGHVGGLLKSLVWTLIVGVLGKRSLKRSGLVRRLFAAAPGPIASPGSRAEFTQ